VLRAARELKSIPVLLLFDTGVVHYIKGKAREQRPSMQCSPWNAVFDVTATDVLEQHLAASDPYVMGKSFTIADIPAGLVVNRWFSISFQKPEFKAVSAYYDRLTERAAYRAHGRNGTP